MILLAQAEKTIELSHWNLAIAACLVLVAGIGSLLLRLHLERQLLIASVRTVTQLLLIGYVLRWVFNFDQVSVVLGISAVMITVAARAAVARSERTFAGVTWDALITLTMMSLLTTITATYLVIQVDPWYEPQYFIPLLGMVLGNTLTGISLSLDTFLERLLSKKSQIEMDLAHGASRWEASRSIIAESARRGMIPMINSMMVVGLVSLPGMMTGQILAGADPLQAVKYQIVVMFMLAAASALGCIGILLLANRRMFDQCHRLQSDLIRKT